MLSLMMVMLLSSTIEWNFGSYRQTGRLWRPRSRRGQDAGLFGFGLDLPVTYMFSSHLPGALVQIIPIAAPLPVEEGPQITGNGCMLLFSRNVKWVFAMAVFGLKSTNPACPDHAVNNCWVSVPAGDMDELSLWEK